MIETGLEGFVMALPWFHLDRYSYEVKVGPEPWFSWGYLSRSRKDDPHGWYIALRLPSYSMRSAWHRWDGAPTWHQAVLVYKNTLAGKSMPDGGWQIMDMELPEDMQSAAPLRQQEEK